MIRKDADLNATIANIKGCLNKLVQMVRELHMKPPWPVLMEI